jgi:hypothetical protein
LDTIVTIRVDPPTGKLTPNGEVVQVGGPCTIAFAGG